jgi:zinc protease
VYGPDSIYARTPRRSSVAGLAQRDVASWLAAWQRPDSALLGLVGDFQVCVLFCWEGAMNRLI